MEGRGPGLRGSEIAAKYIATQFELDGLKPAGDNGTYFQMVKFVGVKAIPEKTRYRLVLTPNPDGKSTDLNLKYGDDYLISTSSISRSLPSTSRLSSSDTASQHPSSAGTTTPAST